jgi:pimeloyl-ACP methyl ester carboxylesterase
MGIMSQRSFVLIPGAGGNAAQWQLVEPLLHNAGFHSAAVSLPNWPGATLADQADAIITAAGPADPVTLVAQSMGAFSAPLTCDRLPVDELVLLNAMIPVAGETPGEWWSNTGQAEAMRMNDLREGRNPDAGFDAQFHFFHDLPPEVLEMLMSSGDASSPATSLFETGFPLSGWPDVPTTVLAGRDDRFFPYEFQRRLAKERLGLEAEALPGGHLLVFSQPDALVARLLRDL